MSSIPLPALHIAQQPDPLSEFSRVAQLRSMLQQQKQQEALAPLQQQQAQLQVQQQQQELKDQQAMTQAMQDSKSLDDIPELILKNGGSAKAAISFQQNRIAQKKQLADLSADQFKIQQQQADLFQGAHDQVMNAPADQRPQAYQQAVAGLKAAGADTSQLPPDYPGDKNFEMLAHPLRLHSQLIAEADKEREIKVKEQEANQKDWEVVSPLGVRVNKTTGETQPIAGATMSPQMMEAKYVALQQKKNLGQPLSADESAFAKGFEKYKTLVPTTTLNLQAGLLSDQAKQMAADTYAQTGQLPAGMRSPAMSAGILNKAAGAPGSEVPNIAANKAAYAADTASLKKLQTSADQVDAFEKTAGKNLDVFLNTAKKVIDSGSPWITKPLRSIDANALGSADQAAFNTARQTAVTEIARVLNSANASGVLSDSARHEVNDLIGPNATLAQIYSAANILKQDMANRHQSYQQQIAEIRSRSAGGKTSPATPQSGGMVLMKAPNGMTKQVPAEQVEHYKSLGATVVNSQ